MLLYSHAIFLCSSVPLEWNGVWLFLYCIIIAYYFLSNKQLYINCIQIWSVSYYHCFRVLLQLSIKCTDFCLFFFSSLCCCRSYYHRLPLLFADIQSVNALTNFNCALNTKVKRHNNSQIKLRFFSTPFSHFIFFFHFLLLTFALGRSLSIFYFLPSVNLSSLSAEYCPICSSDIRPIDGPNTE